MVVFIIAMVLILAVALGVCAVVMLGLRHPGADPDASFSVSYTHLTLPTNREV